MKNTKKGFTLIELLVVIAIIGILASVVLVNLNSAREKGSDAKIKTTLSNVRSAAELMADGGSYEDVCTAGEDIDVMLKSLASSGIDAATNCEADADGWSVTVPLVSDGLAADSDHWCVDSTGAAKYVGALGGDTTC